MPHVAEHSLHSVVWTTQLSRGLSGQWADPRCDTEREEEEDDKEEELEGRNGWNLEAPVIVGHSGWRRRG